MRLARVLLGISTAAVLLLGASPSDVLAAQSEQSIRVPGSVTVTNPCTGEVLTAVGTTKLTIGVSRSRRIEVSLEFRGQAGAYRVEFEGERRFRQTATSYLLMQVEGEGEGPTEFEARGHSTVSASPDGRTPTGFSAIVIDKSKCDGKPMGGGTISISDATCPFIADTFTHCFFTVTRTGGSGVVMVNFSMANGTAVGTAVCPGSNVNANFFSFSGTLTMLPGTGTIGVPRCPNVAGFSNAGATFTVNLTAATGGATITDAVGVATYGL